MTNVRWNHINVIINDTLYRVVAFNTGLAARLTTDADQNPDLREAEYFQAGSLIEAVTIAESIG